MNELIKVEVKDDVQVVSARELYKGLEIAQRFSRWVSNNWDMFEENVDYVPCTLSTQQNQYGGTKELDDYTITIDMAKAKFTSLINSLGERVTSNDYERYC